MATFLASGSTYRSLGEALGLSPGPPDAREAGRAAVPALPPPTRSGDTEADPGGPADSGREVQD
jgi:hypothetical protein